MSDSTYQEPAEQGDIGGNGAFDSHASFDFSQAETPKADDSAEGKKKTSKLTDVLKLAKAECKLWHDDDGNGYASFTNNGHTEHWPIDSIGFREWLQWAAFVSSIGSINKEVLCDACAHLSGEAKYSRPCHKVGKRVMKHEGSYWIDLVNDDWQVIRIDSDGWKIVDEPPVRFLRGHNFRALPTPPPPEIGNPMNLFKLTNIPPEERLLVLAWVLECFRPDTPYPVLELTGEQGSAKSTTQEVLRLFIDPNKAMLRARPKTVEDIYVAASNGHLVSYENLSSLSSDMSDALCIVSTGGSYASRTLYTNGEETTLTAKNPVVLNGINRVISKPDLLDRAVTVSLPLIDKRIDEASHQKKVEELASDIFGGLLDLFVKTLQILPGVEIAPEKLPRMADFTRLGEAMSQALGNPADAFLEAYIDHRREAVVNTIDSTPIGRAICAFINSDKWHTGTVGDLLYRLNEFENKSGIEHGDYWPKAPKSLGNALRRLAPALRQIGIECSVESKSRRDGTYCVLKRSG